MRQPFVEDFARPRNKERAQEETGRRCSVKREQSGEAAFCAHLPVTVVIQYGHTTATLNRGSLSGATCPLPGVNRSPWRRFSVFFLLLLRDPLPPSCAWYIARVHSGTLREESRERQSHFFPASVWPRNMTHGKGSPRSSLRFPTIRPFTFTFRLRLEVEELPPLHSLFHLFFLFSP